MIDLLIVEGTLKTYELADFGRGAQTAYLQTSGTKFKPSTEYAPSPLTLAQMELTIGPDFDAQELLKARFKIPLATALLGQNCMHGWTENLGEEKRTAAELIRAVLLAYQFSSEEINNFVDSVVTENAELTWHIATNGARAARNLLRRIYEMIKVLHEHNRLHDIGIDGYSFIDRSQRCSLKVYLKSGAAMKFYVKTDELSDPNRRRTRGVAMQPAYQADMDQIRGEIDGHLRVEVLPGAARLRKSGLSNPRSWSADALEALIDEVLKEVGFSTTYAADARRVDVSHLSATVQQTYAAYVAGEGLDKLSKVKLSRHRRQLLTCGVDIAIAPEQHQYLRASIGKQIHYDKRWRAPLHLRDFMMSEHTLPILHSTLREISGQLRVEYTPERLGELEAERWQAQSPRRASKAKEVLEQLRAERQAAAA